MADALGSVKLHPRTWWRERGFLYTRHHLLARKNLTCAWKTHTEKAIINQGGFQVTSISAARKHWAELAAALSLRRGDMLQFSNTLVFMRGLPRGREITGP